MNLESIATTPKPPVGATPRVDPLTGTPDEDETQDHKRFRHVIHILATFPHPVLPEDEWGWQQEED